MVNCIRGYCAFSSTIRSLNLFFSFLIFIFLISQHLQYIRNTNPFFYSYLDDILCIPIVLYIASYIMRRIEKNRGDFQFSNFHIITAVVVFSIVFEIILPSISMRYTDDIMDVLCYGLGGVVFTIMNRQNKTQGVALEV